MDVRFEQGLRVSDEATVEVAKMVLVGKQNKDIVLRLGRHGQPAVGLCGDDGLLFRVRKQLADGETDLGFVGEIEQVNVDVLNHIAEDYIPVIASVGADSLGNSYNVNADAAAAAVAAALGAKKVLFLTDVEGWRGCADDPGSLISEATVAAGARAARRGGGRHAAQARGLHRRADRRASRPPTSSTAARSTPCCSSCSPTRASGPSCGPRGAAGTSSATRSCPPTPATRSSSCAARARGCGTATATSTSTSWPASAWCSSGHSHPAVVGAVQRPGRAPHARGQPLLLRARACGWPARLSELGLGGKAFFTNSGAEAVECALKLARKHKAGGDVVVLEKGFHGRTYGALSATPQETKQAPFAPLVPGLPGGRARQHRPAGGRRHRGRADRADPGRVGDPAGRPRGAARRPRGLRRPRRAADLRRDPVRHGPHRRPVGLAGRGGAGPT